MVNSEHGDRARVLVWGFSSRELESVKSGFQGLGIRAPSVLEERHLGLFVKDLAVMEASGRRGSRDDSPVVLFSGISGGSVQTLMRHIKSLDVRRPIFAMITEQSREWTLAELLKHLRAEDEAVRKKAAQRRSRE